MNKTETLLWDDEFNIEYDIPTPSFTGFSERHALLDDGEKLAWLRLIRTEHIGPMTFYALIHHFGTAREALHHLPDFWRERGYKRSLSLCPVAQIEHEIEQTKKSGGDFLFASATDYPRLLKELNDCPPVLIYRGRLELLQKMTVAIVGSRNASMNGCKIAQQFAQQLGAGQYGIISGLARGIDTHAHLGSLTSGTIAVLGGGLAHIYPRENEKLYYQIAEQGIILSENPLHQVARAIDFPRRNRIVAGIAAATLVVEATPKSGSLITARLASEQGREVFAIPGSPLDPRAKGTNDLIRNGATLTDSAQQIMEALRPYQKQNILPLEPETKQTNGITTHDQADEKTALLRILSTSPVDIDDVIAQTQIPASVFLTHLLELEIEGLVVRHDGNKISLS